ncbi:MAG: hypothetical protein ACO3JL_11340 [Myxococcota bacterium]
MPLFSDPSMPPGLLETRRLLGRYAVLFLAVTGGAALAVALSSSSLPAVVLAVVVVVTSLAAPRAPVFTGVVEVLALSAAMALLLPSVRDWGWFGVACLLAARASSMWRFLRPDAERPISRPWRALSPKPMFRSNHDDPFH